MAMEGVYKLSVSRGEKKRGDEACCVTVSAQSSPCQGNTRAVDASTNSGY